MDSISVKTQGGERWMVILGCPLKEKHSIASEKGDLLGPGFADCARCEHQAGRNLEVISNDDIGAYVYPERLVCGFQGRKRAQKTQK